jgi:hypothetical protein
MALRPLAKVDFAPRLGVRLAAIFPVERAWMAPAALPVAALSVALVRAARLLAARLEALEQRIREGDESAWPDFLTTVQASVELEARLTPGSHDELITTRELAARLSVSPKTILRRKKTGALTPAFAAGKLIRWKLGAGR